MLVGRLRRKLLIVVLTVAIGLVCAEATVRLFGPVPPADLLPFRVRQDDVTRLFAGDTYMQFDRDLGWSQRPGARVIDDGIVFQSNVAGFRAPREYDLQPPASGRRIAAFGDSFTHCDEVNVEDCWSERLAAAWDGSEVLNFGVPAGAPDQGWLRYQRDARAYQPCAVLIGFQVENVNRVVNRYRPFYAPGTGIVSSKPRFVVEGTELRLLPNPVTESEQLNDLAWVERTLGPHDFWYYPGMFAPSTLDDLVLVRLTRTAVYQRHRAAVEGGNDERRTGRAYSPEDERFQVSGRLLVEFARSVEADGATPVVIVFGQKHEVVAVRHREAKESQPLLDWLAAERIATIDATNDLAREANRIGVEPLFARNGHYSRRGNQIVGERLAERLPALTRATCP